MKIRRTRSLRAFSLIEICLALGIIAVALVGIIGLLPTAVNTGAEGQRETVAALITRTILSGLSAKSPMIQKRAGSEAEPINLRADGKATASFDESGNLAESDAKAIYTAEVSVFRNTPQKDLSRVEIAVRTPAGAKPENQRSYVFVTQFNATDPSQPPAPKQ